MQALAVLGALGADWLDDECRLGEEGRKQGHGRRFRPPPA